MSGVQPGENGSTSDSGIPAATAEPTSTQPQYLMLGLSSPSVSSALKDLTKAARIAKQMRSLKMVEPQLAGMGKVLLSHMSP